MQVKYVAESLEIQSVQVINHWVNAYRKKIDGGLITLAPMTDKQKRDLHILQQRNKELERTEGCMTALEIAIGSRTKIQTETPLIHHSDRGSQYCSFQYVSKLRESGISDNGDPYENAMAERVNGILKVDFRLNRVFKSRAEALLATKSAIVNYNMLRPNMSCDYLTPQTAHFLDQPMLMHWKTKKSIPSLST